jgi:hypothetical protein
MSHVKNSQDRSIQAGDLQSLLLVIKSVKIIRGSPEKLVQSAMSQLVVQCRRSRRMSEHSRQVETQSEGPDGIRNG